MPRNFLQVEQRFVERAGDFIDQLRYLAIELDPPDFESRWVFRGHADSDWALKPSAWRDDGQRKLARLRGYIERTQWRALPVGATRTHLSEARLQAMVELEAVRMFYRMADDLGIHIPDTHEISDPFGTDVGTCIHWGGAPFAMAQHHGIPTRLLDWTRHPLIAAFFAASENPLRDPPVTHLCVWAVPRTPVVNGPWEWLQVQRSQHPYLHAQHGVFAVNTEGDAFYRDHGYWPSFGEVGNEHSGTETVRAIQLIIRRSEAEALLRHLHANGVSKAHLMPTLDNVAETIRAKWNWL